MKTFLNTWWSTIFTGLVIMVFGTIIIVQNLQHSAIQLKLHEELIDVYHFNGQITTDNAVKEIQLEQADEVLEHQHKMLQDMYNELMKLKGIPPLPDNGEKRPNRSKA